MPRRLPNCAYCGRHLRTAAGYAILRWDGLPGKPAIGWCDQCNYGNRDRLFGRLKPSPNGPAIDSRIQPTLKAIGKRGPDRVIRNRTRESKSPDR